MSDQSWIAAGLRKRITLKINSCRKRLKTTPQYFNFIREFIASKAMIPLRRKGQPGVKEKEMLEKKQEIPS